MFEGEKRDIFWIGLIILSLASIILLGTFWLITTWYQLDKTTMFIEAVTVIAGAIVFIFI